MGDLAASSVREVKRAAAEEKERDEYSSAEGVRVEVKGKVIPTSFLNIEGSVTFIEAKDRRDRGTVSRIGR